MDKWNSRWDLFCFLRANNPSKHGWALLVVLVLVVIALAIAGALALPALPL